MYEAFSVGQAKLSQASFGPLCQVIDMQQRVRGEAHAVDT